MSIILIIFISMRQHNYYVYILTNKAKTVLYTGVTNNLFRRLSEHNADADQSGKTFAGKYKCRYLIYYEHFTQVTDAISREKEIKGWKRNKKNDLIQKMNPDWRFLNDEVEI
jgi:putative endonuclease